MSVISPTRRRLLALIAASPAIDLPPEAETASAATGPGLRQDPVRAAFLAFQVHLAAHKHALQLCDRLEAALVAEHGYPRVRLPTTADAPARYAADTGTITRTVPAGRRRDCLQRTLCRRQQRWDEAAHAVGLDQAREREETLYRVVRTAAEALYATPATTGAGILCKLLVLLSLEKPGEAFRDVSPWRELRIILANLDRLSACYETNCVARRADEPQQTARRPPFGRRTISGFKLGVRF